MRQQQEQVQLILIEEYKIQNNYLLNQLIKVISQEWFEQLIITLFLKALAKAPTAKCIEQSTKLTRNNTQSKQQKPRNSMRIKVIVIYRQLNQHTDQYEKSPHIIRYYDMLKSQTNFYFVYQFCDGGTLQGLLDKQKKLPETEALKILKQLLTAFKLLYKFHVMHRDLKPDNIFFKDGVVKLGDFGFCKNIQKTNMTKTMLGSPIYMAPQILRGQVYSSKADIWSIGVVLFQMLYGYCPFQSSSIPKLLKILQSTDVVFPNNISVSAETKELLKKILTKNPKYRIQWNQLFELKISEQGKLINEKNPLRNILGNERKGSWGARTVQGLSQKRSNNKSLSKNKEITPVMNRQHTVYQMPMTTKNVHSRNHSISQYSRQKRKQEQTNFVTQKKYLPSVQQDTDDQSKKHKFFKRQKAFMRVKTITNLQNVQDKSFNTTGNLRALLKRARSTNPDNQPFFDSKQKVVSKHSEIIQGNSIARNLQCVNQKHANFFSQIIYITIMQRLEEFKEQLIKNGGYQEVVNLANHQVEQLKKQVKKLQQESSQSTEIQQGKTFDRQIKKQLKQRIPECRHLRLCYDLVMFLVQQTACNALKNQQMQRIINLKLSC